MRTKVKAKKRLPKAFKICYLILVLVLVAGISYGFVYIWKACAEYHSSSVQTLLAQVEEQASATAGTKISASPVPSVDAEGNSVFTLKNGTEKVGTATLRVKKKGLLTLALYEIEGIQGSLSRRFIAPEGVSVYAAGKAVAPEEEAYWFGSEPLAEFEGDKAAPRLYRYSAEHLLDFSQASVKRSDLQSGQPAGMYDPADITLIEQKDGSLLAAVEYPKEGSEALKKRAFELAEQYSRFISTDISWSRLSPQVMAGSPLKKSIPSLEVRWYNKHSAVQFLNKRISEPLRLSDSYALVYLSYDFVVTKNRKDYTMPTELALYLHKDSDGVWRMAELNTNLHYDIPLSEYDM